ncbi:DUF2283 domain-containing protein [Virgibacillus salexigens]|uniref:DUF2283 domain-containing protein n=1 Tax=Virgibacillus salexigens TaxID=61016 RepID=UPI00190D1C2B|nr:DUF2283 domain-containing protein [Virgibacillus salexigens]
MGRRIEFDDDVKIGYVYIVNKKYKYKIDETEELEVNPFLNVDIDKNGIIIGIELFEEEALGLKEILNNKKRMFIESPEGYSFRMSQKEVRSKFVFRGLRFCFSNVGYKGLIGIDIIVPENYPAKYIL